MFVDVETFYFLVIVDADTKGHFQGHPTEITGDNGK